MKYSIRAMAAAAMLIGTATAGAAADIPRGTSPYYAPPASVYNWAGFYVGANLGYEWGKITNTNGSPSGIEGGLQAGYNWQNGQFVFGGETDIQFSGADDTFAPYKFSNPWFGTLRARAGYAFNYVLAYVTVGLAFGDVEGESGALTETKTQVGWTLGAGAEIGLAPNWSAKVEYLYMDLGSRSYSITGSDNGLEASLVRLGVNYHF
jgi:outer membrane immunogenic protein